jgi:hydrogenase maturation protein HypF
VRAPTKELIARDIVVSGRVQGVGYRPFVYVTAHDLGIQGTVLNGSGRVFIHAEGSPGQLDRLEHALVHSAPPLARPQLVSSEPVEFSGVEDFSILASDSSSESEIHVPPDLYTCDDCVEELITPQERRHGYPFINCTQCGPRYTIITAIPYDRPNTSMAGFALCDECRAEYESPRDRRFHAQPLACDKCGPQLEFICKSPLAGDSGQQKNKSDKSEDTHKSEKSEDTHQKSEDTHKQGPLLQAVEALHSCLIVAIKGVGGYHLICDASSDEAVQRLRHRKHRPHKPLAVMFPTRGDDGLEAIREHLELSESAAHAILDPARPIVLARKCKQSGLSSALAPGLGELGVFLPYSPLHHLLLQEFGGPVVATSGNISGEPVITDNREAEQRLALVADAFLHHNRPIVRPADDPVIRPMAGKARVIRLGRGIAPLERSLTAHLEAPTLAVGGHMKVTIALAWDDRVVVSPHIGDMDSPRSNNIFQKVIEDLQNLYDVKARQIICDLHPGYATSRWAKDYCEQRGLPLHQVQHHAAHASALAGEHPDIERWLVFAWDGVGYGSDGSLWGGEALAGNPGEWKRVASFRTFRLVGGEKAGREPWRSAAALLWAEGRDWKPAVEGADLARLAWEKNINIFETSAVGRLFDAAAALVLGRDMASFEGQGPMELEQLTRGANVLDPVPLPLTPDGEGILRTDWAPMLPVLCDSAIAPVDRADFFHQCMANALVDQALAVRKQSGFDAIGLSGGVFQNRCLTELVAARLEAQDIEVRLHETVPANDGGLCFGQIIDVAGKKQ